MIIGIDCDGVLADFNDAYMQLIRDLSGEDKFGEGYVPTTWNYPESVGYSPETVSRAWELIEESNDFWAELPALDGMNQLIEWINVDDHDFDNDLYFITSRPGKYSKIQTELWFSEWSLPATILVSSEKGLCCEALKIDRYIDDKIENIIQVQVGSKKTQPFLLDQPWNKGADLPRVYSVEEFLSKCS